MKASSDPEADDEAVAETLRRIREAEAIGATAFDLGGLDALNLLPRESLPLTPEEFFSNDQAHK